MTKKVLMIWASGTLALAAVPQTTPAATSKVVTVINVTAFGAKGDGVTDDRPAIQAAIDALAARRGGVLRIPKGTYLLNSYSPAAHPWGFHNLLVGSRIHIEGEPGATLLQGEKGRAPLPSGATMVKNAVVVVGTPLYAVVPVRTPNSTAASTPCVRPWRTQATSN